MFVRYTVYSPSSLREGLPRNFISVLSSQHHSTCHDTIVVLYSRYSLPKSQGKRLPLTISYDRDDANSVLSDLFPLKF